MQRRKEMIKQIFSDEDDEPDISDDDEPDISDDKVRN